MKYRIIFATGNEEKMREVRMILNDLKMEVVSMREAGAVSDAEENGASFAENSEIKAREVWEQTGGIVLADDSGLVVDYLNGEPGVYSARWMGEDTSYDIKNQMIIERLRTAKREERTARFVCNIAAVMPDGQVFHTEDTMEGLIAEAPAGYHGFGYDPILYLPEYQMTSAQLTPEQKNHISHRGKALVAMKEKIRKFCGEDLR